MSKHTPGPWKVHTGNGYEREILTAKTNKPITSISNCHYKHSMANANLIAAAPEMLELIEACESYIALQPTPEAHKLIDRILALKEKLQ